MHPALKPADLLGCEEADRNRQPRQGSRLHVAREAPERHDADAHAPVHQDDERLFKKWRTTFAPSRSTRCTTTVKEQRGTRMTPAMKAGVTDTLRWSFSTPSRSGRSCESQSVKNVLGGVYGQQLAPWIRQPSRPPPPCTKRVDKMVHLLYSNEKWINLHGY